jgi:hypothetical protein
MLKNYKILIIFFSEHTMKNFLGSKNKKKILFLIYFKNKIKELNFVY